MKVRTVRHTSITKIRTLVQRNSVTTYAFTTLTHIASNNEVTTSVRDVKQLRVVVLARRSSSTLALITFPSRRVGQITFCTAKRRTQKNLHRRLYVVDGTHTCCTIRLLKLHRSVNYERIPAEFWHICKATANETE